MNSAEVTRAASKRIKHPARCKPVRRAYKRWCRRSRRYGGPTPTIAVWLTYTHESRQMPELFRYAWLHLKAALT